MAVMHAHDRSSRPWRRWPAAAAVLLAAGLLTGGAAVTRAADPPQAIAVRGGNHRDFGRLVFDATAATRYHVARDGDRVTISFPDPVALSAAPPAPRNVAAVHSGPDHAELVLKPGATFHVMRLGSRIVIDVFDPTSANPEPAHARPGRRADPRPAQAAAAHAPDAAPHPAGPARSPGRSEPPTAAAHAPDAAPHGAGPRSPQRSDPPTAAPHDQARVPDLTPEAIAAAAAHRAPPAGRSGSAPRQRPSPVAAASSPGGAAASPDAGERRVAGTGAAAEPVRPSPAPGHPEAGHPAMPFAAAQPAGDAMPPPPDAAPVAPVTEAPPTATGTDRLPVADTPLSAPAGGPAGGPVALMAQRAPAPNGRRGVAFALPIPTSVGGAVFRHGLDSFIVFDERRPVDLASLRVDPAFGSIRLQLLPNGTMFRLRPPSGLTPSLVPEPHGWTVALLATPPHQSPISPVITPDHIGFTVSQPNGVIAVADPDSGATWLVGTQREPGQGLPLARRAAEFALLPTTQGLVVEPFADSIALRMVPIGFELTGPPGGLAISPATPMSDVLAAAGRLTRRFDFPAMPTQSLVRQLTREVGAAAAAPPQARSPKRLAAAMTMMALGLDAEAEALLQVVAEQDPQQAASPDTAGLRAIAALLAGRPAEAGALSDPRLTGTDDIAMWRALALATAQEGSPEAATAFTATAPLAFALPAAMRDRVLPRVLETMIQGGEVAAAGKLLAQRPNDPRLGYARALLAQANGDTDAALRLYDALGRGRDQFDRARAVVRAVELRLVSGEIDAKKAADRLDKLLYVWRGDQRDLAMRERLAELRQQSGGWREALAVLRDAAADFPDQSQEIRHRLQTTFDALLADHAADSVAPLDLITLMDENADLLPTGPEGDPLRLRLADRLLALDLPQRAAPILERLMQAAPEGEARAGIGTRLARLRLREGDTAGALAALGASSASDLPAPLFEQRALLAAAIYGKRHDTAAAMAALSPLSSAAADDARAQVQEQANDWPGVERALVAYVAKTVPETGDLTDDNRRALVRLASAASRAGDAATLAALRVREEGRIGTGPLADMFRLLTAEPVRGTSDLPRAKQEAGLVREVPAGLAAIKPDVISR
jgi:hypothetical protein